MMALTVLVMVAGGIGAALAATASSHYLDHDRPLLGVAFALLFLAGAAAMGFGAVAAVSAVMVSSW